MKNLSFPAALLLALLALAGLAAAAGVSEGATAPDISLQTLDGGETSLYAFIGSSPSLVWFTNFGKASVSAMDDITRLYSLFRERGLALVIVSLRGQDKNIPSRVARARGLEGNIFLDPSGYACLQMAGEYLEGTLPVYNLFLVDGKKIVRLTRHFPGIPYSTLESEIRKLL